MTLEELDNRIREEGEKTRRHVEAGVKRVLALLRTIADAQAHLIRILVDHEIRLRSLEKRV